MFKYLSAAAIAISLIAGPVFAQGNVPVTEPVKVQQTVKPQNVKLSHKPGVRKASLHRAHRHIARHHAAHRHVAHVNKTNKHVAKHIKPVKPAKTVKRIKQDKINTAG